MQMCLGGGGGGGGGSEDVPLVLIWGAPPFLSRKLFSWWEQRGPEAGLWIQCRHQPRVCQQECPRPLSSAGTDGAGVRSLCL